MRGVEVDIVPFGGIKSGDTVTFADGHELDVVGLREAAAIPDTVILPHGLRIPVVSIEAQSALKTLAWRDRHFDTSKDATDLLELLMAGSQGPYGDELWPDEEALAINEFDASLAGAWRIGRGAGRLFDLKRGNHVLDVLNDPRQHQLLRRDMRSILAPDCSRPTKPDFARAPAPRRHPPKQTTTELSLYHRTVGVDPSSSNIRNWPAGAPRRALVVQGCPRTEPDAPNRPPVRGTHPSWQSRGRG